MRVHAFHHLYQRRLAQSTKPFNARGCKVKRCQYCQVSEQYCICEHQPKIKSDVAVMLLLSENEVFKPSNTGRLILDTVEEGYAYQWSRTEPDAEMLALLANEAYQPIIIFPDEYVEERSRLIDINPRVYCGEKKPLLIFLDGSWREARRIFRKSPYLNSLPVLSIQPESLSQYLMRRSDNEQHLATAEVATIVLKQLGEVHASKVLAEWFDAFRESYLLSKTRMKTDERRLALKHYMQERENEKPV
ncbi:cytoplasmic protein [Vibrio caribbeanicus]|uniref:Cytoplasmic protein n=1 Tax=Vibrio caribbeanicus TaxID=701175 RepID=A0ACC4P216_9VIBR|nr:MULTISPECIES: tRNA-uridine aminocarboxypropyltransferase [Vibrio]KHD26937.1 cytoplasmic protein [Vibrio caribbeanicus]KHT38783.1 cytoplasmic protein [Vibrio sinaloensis]